MSLTIKALIIAIVAQFLPLEEVSTFVDAIITIGTLGAAWYGRIRLGDVDFLGFRK